MVGINRQVSTAYSRITQLLRSVVTTSTESTRGEIVCNADLLAFFFLSLTASYAGRL